MFIFSKDISIYVFAKLLHLNRTSSRESDSASVLACVSRQLHLACSRQHGRQADVVSAIQDVLLPSSL